MKKSSALVCVATLIIGFAIVSSCKKETPKPSANNDVPVLNNSYSYASVLAGTQQSGLVSDAGARLGRVLFYDKKLSGTNVVACGSCHKQEYAFADNVSFSNGFNGGFSARNSLSIINAVTSQGFFWDNRTQKLADMVLQPIKNHVEMGLENMDLLIQELNATSYYPQLFNEAFGSPTITSQGIASGLAQFIYSMYTINTKADKSGILNGTAGWGNPPGLTTDEAHGASLFQANCSGCHSGSNLRGWEDALTWGNIGLDSVYADKGLGALTNNPADDGVFKVPSLRNVAYSAPYMHDGRYSTLAQVVDHYNSGIIFSANLSLQLRQLVINGGTYTYANAAIRMNMSTYDKQCLVAFLNTLSDNSLVADPKFSNPFPY